MSGLLSIGISGLHAATVNLATVSHNITNSDTEGYNRQRAVQSTNTGLQTGEGYIGQGVHVTTVARVYSSFLTNSLNASQARASDLDAYYTELSKIDNMLADANSGLSTALDSFFTGVNDAATNPSQSSSRQSMISSAQSLVARYQALDTQLETLYEGVDTQITSTVASINTYAKQIAELNNKIVIAQSANNQPPNDLLDQRDQLVSELNKLVAVTTTTDSNGSYNVFFGTGQQLVVGTQVTTLKAAPASGDASRITVFLSSSGGDQELPESLITGGSLAGLLEFRSESLDKTSSELGLNATALALSFNAQYSLGEDANGNVAGEAGFESDFFSAPTGKVIASERNPSTSPAVSISLSAVSSTSGFKTSLTGSDYRLTVGTTGSLTLTRLSDNVQWTGADVTALNTALAADPQGFTINAATFTAAEAGASYLIEPTRGAAGDIDVNSVIAADTNLITAAAPMRTAVGTSNTGNATISSGSVSTGYAAFNAGTPLTLTYDATTGRLTWPATAAVINGVATTIAASFVAYTSGSTITVAGNNFVISGTPNNGDTFTVSRNSSAISDGRNALALVGLQTTKVLSGGTATYQSNYASLVSDVGNKTREVKTTAAAQETLVTQASDAREALSGVNLDDEAADLIRYQQAYQACAKVIDIASKLFDQILSMNS